PETETKTEILAPSKPRNMLVTSGGHTYYYDKKGKKVKNSFVTVNKRRYYFDKDGKRVTGWVNHNKHTYYCPASGEAYKNVWKKIGGNYYYFGPSYYIRKNRWVDGYYLNADGIRVGEKTSDRSLPKVRQLRMTNYRQNPELPTGCESVALAMVLNYKKFSIKKTTIANYYLPTNNGGNFVTSFAGDPHSSSGCGIYAPGLTIAANKYLKAKKSKLKAYDISGIKLTDLYKYVNNGDPVIVWNGMYMLTPVPSFSYTTLGKTWTFFRNEHCVVLCGYDKKKDKVLINDPLDGLVWRNRSAFERIYNRMGKMAVVIR
ncbi:MAG: C39 family peptidase, partial [Eubacteriales bacterium]|nr:C39 family peptidase [Eubacteriales bacterium]